MRNILRLYKTAGVCVAADVSGLYSSFKSTVSSALQEGYQRINDLSITLTREELELYAKIKQIPGSIQEVAQIALRTD